MSWNLHQNYKKHFHKRTPKIEMNKKKKIIHPGSLADSPWKWMFGRRSSPFRKWIDDSVGWEFLRIFFGVHEWKIQLLLFSNFVGNNISRDAKRETLVKNSLQNIPLFNLRPLIRWVFVDILLLNVSFKRWSGKCASLLKSLTTTSRHVSELMLTPRASQRTTAAGPYTMLDPEKGHLSLEEHMQLLLFYLGILCSDLLFDNHSRWQFHEAVILAKDLKAQNNRFHDRSNLMVSGIAHN